MRAAVCTGYGSPDVVRVAEIPPPTPANHQVLLKVRAAALNPADWHIKKGKPAFARLFTGLRVPRQPQLGMDVAGEIQALGSGVTAFQPGEPVFGTCRGAIAEFACAPAADLVRKPDNLTFEQAAAVPVAAYTALQGLRDSGKLQPGQKVLINGAAGGVGTFAIQIGKWLGANVTAVCSGRNVALARSLGADRAIDYTQQDFTCDAERYDVIFDLVGGRPWAAIRPVLTPHGILVGGGILGVDSLAGVLSGMLVFLLRSHSAGQRAVTFIARPNQGDLALLAELLAQATIRSVIDRCYGLHEVPTAIRHLESKRARGKIVITISGQ